MGEIEDMEDDKGTKHQEDQTPDAPKKEERYSIIISKGDKVLLDVMADGVLVAYHDAQSGNVMGSCKGNTTGNHDADIKVILGMGQACIEVASDVASEIAKAQGFKILANPNAAADLGNMIQMPGRSKGRDN